MIMTNLYMGSRVTNERFLSKDQVIAELKSRIDCLENEKVRRCNESINQMSENMQLHQKLEKAQEEISNLKYELKVCELSNDFISNERDRLKEKLASTETGKLEERVKQLEEERDHYQLLCEQIEFELRQAQYASIVMDLFKNCDSLESLSKRKKVLLSIFHPDNEYGDNEITRMILAQYNKKKEEYL